jgi:hypothetical protein
MAPKKTLLRKGKKGPLCYIKNGEKKTMQYDTDVIYRTVKKNTQKNTKEKK